jgi:hypothetical protein
MQYALRVGKTIPKSWPIPTLMYVPDLNDCGEIVCVTFKFELLVTNGGSTANQLHFNHDAPLFRVQGSHYH